MGDDRATATVDPVTERRLERLGLSGNGSDWAERYLSATSSSTPRWPGRGSASRRWPGRPRPARPALGQDPASPRARQPQAGLLPVDGVPHRPVAGQQHHQPAGGAVVQAALRREGLDFHQLAELEPDAGLGNGGLGRLAACFMESLATLQFSAMGYGLRYEYGIFKQSLQNGYQVEHPDNWLRRPDPWEVARPGKTIKVPLHATVQVRGGQLRLIPNRAQLPGRHRLRPAGRRLRRQVHQHARLWAATAPDTFNFDEFSSGDFVGAVLENIAAESLTRVLYPDDSTEAGRTSAVPAGIFPGLLLAQRHRRPLSQERQPGLVRPARQGRHPAQRHPSGHGRRRVDANPSGSGGSWAGRMPGT